MREVKVLVADDDRLNRVMISKLISKFGGVCSEASNGKIALEMALKETYDIVFLDYNMPGYSGSECAVRIRDEYNGSENTPLIVGVSADEDNGNDSAFDVFLPKPFKIERIQEIILKKA